MIRWGVLGVIVIGFMASIIIGHLRNLQRHFFWQRVVIVWGILLLTVVVALLPLKANDTSNAATNRDIIFLVDITQSMNAIDGRGGSEITRLENARDDMHSIAQANIGANIGIFTFSDQVNLLLPLTAGSNDTNGAIDTIYTATRSSTVGKVVSYTDLFNDVGTYLEAQQRSDSTRQRVVVMLSDFEVYKNQEKPNDVVVAASKIKAYGGGFVGLLYGQQVGARMLNYAYDYETGEYLPYYKRYGHDDFTKYVTSDYQPVTSVPDLSLAQAIGSSLTGDVIQTRDSQDFRPALEKAAKQSGAKAAQSAQTQAINQNIFYIFPACMGFVWLCISDIITPSWLRVLKLPRRRGKRPKKKGGHP